MCSDNTNTYTKHIQAMQCIAGYIACAHTTAQSAPHHLDTPYTTHATKKHQSAWQHVCARRTHTLCVQRTFFEHSPERTGAPAQELDFASIHVAIVRLAV